MIAWLLVACLVEEDFRVQADEAVCDWKADCYETSYETCVDDAAGSEDPVDPACTYQEREARRCLRGLEALGCPTNLDELDEDFGFPTACDEVWICE